jgi:hypothetical protein
MKRQALLTKSVGTKVSEAELASLEERARCTGLTLSTWVRKFLLAAPVESCPNAGEVALAEVLALRTILINLLFSISQGKPITAEATQVLIDRTDADKMKRAMDHLIAARLTDLESKPGNKSTAKEED